LRGRFTEFTREKKKKGREKSNRPCVASGGAEGKRGGRRTIRSAENFFRTRPGQGEGEKLSDSRLLHITFGNFPKGRGGRRGGAGDIQPSASDRRSNAVKPKRKKRGRRRKKNSVRRTSLSATLSPEGCRWEKGKGKRATFARGIRQDGRDVERGKKKKDNNSLFYGRGQEGGKERN